MLRQLKPPYPHPQTPPIEPPHVGHDAHRDKSQYPLVHPRPLHHFPQVRGTGADPKMSPMTKGKLPLMDVGFESILTSETVSRSSILDGLHQRYMPTWYQRSWPCGVIRRRKRK
jgi:hypothetical protein